MFCSVINTPSLQLFCDMILDKFIIRNNEITVTHAAHITELFK